MSGTISKIVRFEDEEEFLVDMENIMERFTYLTSRYGGGNVIEGFLLWDYVEIQDDEGIKIFRIGEFPYIEGALKVDYGTLRILERYFDEIESRWSDLSVEEIDYFIRMLNEALEREIVFYEAYDLGLNRDEAYLILNIKALHYLDRVVDAEDREVLEEAVRLLMKYV
ncbi:hypothetical protein [Thermococcus sp.]